MSRAEDLVIAYLDLLHRHKKSVARAYHSGSLIADEEVSPRAINDLRNQRTLVPLAPDTFRLASSLTRHFDEILQKEQLFAIVGSNIAELAERLTFLVDETVEAHVAGRTEALDGYADDFTNSVCDLGAQIAQALQYLRMLADTRFASVRTQAEKVRQNTWYISRAERIGNVLKTLQAGGLIERIEEEAAAAALLPAFRTQLWDRLPEWRESLLDITEILKAYLYRLRQVQPEGRRLRAFHLFLRRNPDYTLPDLSELTEIPEWARGADPLPIAAHPDYQDATPAAWDGMTRAEALALGPNEKFTATPVKRERVAIKTLPGNPLCCDGREILLPPGSHLDVSGPAITPLLRHMSILFVENWESFDRIHATDPDRINFRPAGVNPLVLWRGDSSDTRPNHALALLRALGLPVWAFVDFDPAGLHIAASLPGLAGIIAPESEFLTKDLQRGDHDRYMGQIHAAQAVLNACPSEPVQRLWAIIRQVGRALPQERYLIAGATHA